MLDIINYIKESLHIIIKIKAKEEIDQYKQGKEKKDENAAEDYETLLRKEEAEIRQHISIEHQLKLYMDNMLEKIYELEKDNHLLAKKIVNKPLKLI